MFRFSMLAAGRGSNFKAILEHVTDGSLQAECCSLLTYNASAPVTDLAKAHNIPVRIIDDSNLIQVLLQDAPDLAVMSGYMRKLPESLFEHFENKVINIHPSLLPSFGGKGCYGIHVHEKVIQAGVKITGVTVHFVNKDYDSGKIIMQRAVPVLPNDTPEILAARVLKEEHNSYWQAIKEIANV